MQVLIVEDDEVVRARLEGLLTQHQFDVYAVDSTSAARRAMHALVFPIVIIDRMLGTDDGIVLIAEFRQRYEQHRVFLMVLSALDGEAERRQGMAAGADTYLSKRAHDEELISQLSAARQAVRLRSK